MTKLLPKVWWLPFLEHGVDCIVCPKGRLDHSASSPIRKKSQICLTNTVSSRTYMLINDDTQLYASCRAAEVNAIRGRLSDCTADVATWCAYRRLQLNPDKTKVIWFGSRAALKKLNADQRTLQVGSSTIQLYTSNLI